MKEQTTRRIANTGAWIAEHIAHVMEQTGIPTRDVAYGKGHEFFAQGIPDHDEMRSITFFPDSKVVRVTSPNVRVELFRASPPIASQSGIHVRSDSGESHLLFLRSGQVALSVEPAPPIEPLDAATAEMLGLGDREVLISRFDQAMEAARTAQPLESPSGIPASQNAEDFVSGQSPGPGAPADEIRASRKRGRNEPGANAAGSRGGDHA